MELIHYNFFTIGSIIATIFCFYIARLLLTIPDRSSASNHLGLAIFFLGLFHTGYFFSFSINDPISAYARWLVCPTAMFGAIELGRFFINFKDTDAKRKDRIFAYILYGIVLIGEIYFIAASWNSTRIYYPQSHYADFILPGFYKVYSVSVFSYFIVFSITGILTYRRVSKEDKFTALAILIAFLIVTIIPGVLNALSRDGAVSRATYQASVDLLVVIGLFFVVIIYINNTDDKTTIISRITGISMATFMLVLQVIAFIAISNQENSYDRQKIQEARLATSSKQYSEEINEARMD